MTLHVEQKDYTEEFNSKEASVQNKEVLKQEEQNNTRELTKVELSITKKTTLEEKFDDFTTRSNNMKAFLKAQLSDAMKETSIINFSNTWEKKATYQLTAKEAAAELGLLAKMDKKIKAVQNRNYPSQELANQEFWRVITTFLTELQDMEAKMPKLVDAQTSTLLNKENISTFDISTQMRTLEGSKKVAALLHKINNKQLQLNTATLDVAEQELYNRDLKAFEEYLNTLISNPNADFSKITFAPKYTKILKDLQNDTAISAYITTPADASSENITPTTDAEVQKNFNKKLQQEAGKEQVSYKDWQEAFGKGGINGLTNYGLDQTKMSPEQKETWKGVGNLAVTGGLIFLWWKAISTAFKALSKSWREKLDKDGGRGWLWMPVAATFGANMLTGESPLALLNGGKGSDYIIKLFGGKDNEKSPIAQAYTEGFTGVSSLFGGLTCAQVADNLDTSADGKMKLKPNFFDTILATAKWDPSNEKKVAAVKFLEKVGKDDPNNLINTALVAMGIDVTFLKNNTNANVSFNEKAANAIARLASVTEYMEKNNFDRINQSQLYLIQEYIASQKAIPEDLAALQSRRGDLFENSLTAPDEATKKILKDKIDVLGLSDIKNKDLTDALNNFWGAWPITKDLKQLDIKKTGNSISLTTYGKSIKLDLEKNSLVWLVDKNKQSVRFQSLYEMLKVANLTNRILDLTKNNKNPLTKDPFNGSWIGGDIEYDNTKFWSNPVERFDHMDSTVVSGGHAWALAKISPILESQKDAYVALLNKEYNRINKLI